MADSMCGPSNALQSFHKHSTVDRTLQQDRLIARQSPSQGFRSSPGPNAGLLDPEFEAFQAGQLPLDHPFHTQGFSHTPPNLQQAGPSGWASDFQQMHISSPGPQMRQETFSAQVQNRQDTAGWHQDFALQQQNQMAANSITQGPSAMYPGYQGLQTPMTGFVPQFVGGVPNTQAEMSLGQQAQPVEAFDEEAFARAFDEAAKAEMQSETTQELRHDVETGQELNQSVEIGQDVLISESAERLMSATEGPLNQERIGADTIHDPLSQETEDHNGPGALARTAAKLLDSVQHDQSSKFQNSQFLELMRQFRDGMATVEGDQVVGGNREEILEGELKEELSNLIQQIRDLALNGEELVKGEQGEQIRLLLQLLLQSEHILSQISTSCIEKKRALEMAVELQKVPNIESFPSVVFLAMYIASDGECIKKDWIHPAMTIPKSKIIPWNENFPNYFMQDYINNEHTSSLRKALVLSNLLGYSLSPSIFDPSNDPSLTIHKERAKDILGREMYEVVRICKDRGIYCVDLPQYTVERLGKLYERKGGGSEAFKEGMRKAEKEVEGRLKGWVEWSLRERKRNGGGEEKDRKLREYREGVLEGIERLKGVGEWMEGEGGRVDGNGQ